MDAPLYCTVYQSQTLIALCRIMTQSILLELPRGFTMRSASNGGALPLSHWILTQLKPLARIKRICTLGDKAYCQARIDRWDLKFLVNCG